VTSERVFDRLLPSLEPLTPPGSQVCIRVRLRVGDAWTAWLPVGVYGVGAQLPRRERVEPSVGARLKTDVIHCATPARAAEVRLELARAPGAATSTPGPAVRRLTVTCWTRRRPPPPPARRHAAWGKTLDVPQRSQGVEDPAIAARICSPTSLSMVLAHWGRELPTSQVAAGVHDRGADIYGNWGFNVAYAARLGFEAVATHLVGLEELEAEIAAGRPVVISHRYPKGALTNAAVSATDGHLIVVVGFTAEGDVVVNDPAANPTRGHAIRRVYRRAELHRTWQVHGEGVAYLVRPLDR
jgi:hypothetical protein